MNQRLVVLALAASIPAVTAAQSNRNYPCTNGNLTRRVEVAYTSSANVPCEVRYYKETGDAPQVLWRAATQSGYCEAQARDFVAKLQGMGWTCSDSGTSTTPDSGAAPRAADDTNALSPGREANR